MSESDDVDDVAPEVVARLEGTPFEAIDRLDGASTETLDATVETATAMLEFLAENGQADHGDFAHTVMDGLHRKQRKLRVGRKPSTPMSGGAFYWKYAVALARTADAVRLDGYTFDPEAALSGAALHAELEQASLSAPARDRLEGYIRDCRDQLRAVDVPLTAYELHQAARSVPESAKDSEGHESALETLGSLPGVNPPDPETPAWRYLKATS